MKKELRLKQTIMPNKSTFLCHLLFLFISLIFAFPSTTCAQENNTDKQEEIIPVKTIELNEISVETEKLGQRIRRLRDILKPTTKTNVVDSLLNTTYSSIENERDTLFRSIESFSQRRLQDARAFWDGHKSQLKEYQNTIDSRIKILNEVNDEIIKEIDRWENTKSNFSENSESEELFANLDTMIARLQDVLQVSFNRLDRIFVIQKQLTQVVFVADEVIAEIKRMEVELQKNYFVFDSPPIWDIGQNSSQETAVISQDSTQKTYNLISGLGKDGKQLYDYLCKNNQTFIFQLVFILLLLTLLLVVKRKWTKALAELTNPLEVEAKRIINNPVSATLAVGCLISALFYETLIPVYRDLLIIVILSATVYILPKLSDSRVKFPLGILLTLFILQTIEIYFTPSSVWTRILLFTLVALLFTSLYSGWKVLNANPDNFRKILVFRRYILPFYLLFTSIAFIGNIIGMVGLSRFLVSAVSTSVILGAVVYLAVKVFTSIFILVFKLRNYYNLRTINTLIEVSQKRVRPVLAFAGIIVWIIFTLIGFNIYEYLKIWVSDILQINWQIGQMTVSVGGLLAFTTIFLVTLFVARIIANIFQDEWLINVLPRGIAPAISLIIRIVLIATGFYMALSSAGFDVSKIGILLGALGVGIGFGLQSVVLNFISGLILAFERPINLGDAIEVDQEFGVVTSIGVRASNIKTYQGSEVIIPNGDLVSKKVKNWTLSNRDRRSRILMKTSSEADPYKVIELFNRIATEHPSVYKNPAPTTHFYGYNQEGNLDFALIYWTSFSDTLNTDSDIALKIYKTLNEEGIQAPIPKWKIVGSDNFK